MEIGGPSNISGVSNYSFTPEQMLNADKSTDTLFYQIWQQRKLSGDTVDKFLVGTKNNNIGNDKIGKTVDVALYGGKVVTTPSDLCAALNNSGPNIVEISLEHLNPAGQKYQNAHNIVDVNR